MRLGVLSHILAPGYSWCVRCKTAWRFIEEQSVYYKQGRGCFALCVECWNETTEEERVRAHMEMMARYWYQDKPVNEEEVALVLAAVRRESRMKEDV